MLEMLVRFTEDKLELFNVTFETGWERMYFTDKLRNLGNAFVTS